APRPAHAQTQTAAPPAPQTPATPAAPAADTPKPIPVAEVAGRADEVSAFLRSIDEQLPPSAPITKIEGELGPLSEKLAERAEQTKRTIEANPGLGALDSLTDSWQSGRLGLMSWMSIVTDRANWLEQQRALLGKLNATWTLTRQELRVAKVPPELLQRTLDTVGAITSAQGRVETQRAATLVLQDRIARELTRTDAALASIGQARKRAADTLFRRDSPPLWRLRPRPAGEMSAAVADSLAEQLAALRAFVNEQPDRIVLHAVVLLAAGAFILWARRRARRLTAAEGVAQSLAVVFDQPVAAALVLGMLSAFWIYADQPRTARLIAEIGAFPPMLLILRRLVAPPMRPVLYIMAAFFLVDIIRDLVVPLSLFERLLFLLEMLTVMVVLAWLTRSGHGDPMIAASGPAGGGARAGGGRPPAARRRRCAVDVSGRARLRHDRQRDPGAATRVRSSPERISRPRLHRGPPAGGRARPLRPSRGAPHAPSNGAASRRAPGRTRTGAVARLHGHRVDRRDPRLLRRAHPGHRRRSAGSRRLAQAGGGQSLARRRPGVRGDPVRRLPRLVADPVRPRRGRVPAPEPPGRAPLRALEPDQVRDRLRRLPAAALRARRVPRPGHGARRRARRGRGLRLAEHRQQLRLRADRPLRAADPGGRRRPDLGRAGRGAADRHPLHHRALGGGAGRAR